VSAVVSLYVGFFADQLKHDGCNGFMIECTIEKLVFGGQGMGRHNGKVVLAWNALPGERVSVEVQKEKKSFITGIAEKILESSPHRVDPQEAHHLSCSPWQILSFEEENKWKGIIAKEQFRQFAHLNLENTDVVYDERQYRYRNKMEYSFWEENNVTSLAFFKRGQKRKIPIDECALAIPSLNTKAKEVLAWLNSIPVSRYDVKSLIVRTTTNQSNTIASLFVMNKQFPTPPSALSEKGGFFVYYSNPKSPASRADLLLHSSGETMLSEVLRGKICSYGLSSFFQVNVPLFERALTRISEFINCDTVVDYYSGTGAISIALSAEIKKAILVESDKEAVEYARKNVEANQLDNFTVKEGLAEKMEDEIKNDRLIIFDPPRAGLHPRIIKQILAEKPPRIVYLSCNFATQARDVELLKGAYAIHFNELYNFFPRTPHIESLIVLDRT
jgi:23S rRNA (uracil1939-C5)-methyltransferase